MNLIDSVIFIKKLTLQIASWMLLLLGLIVVNIHNIVYSTPGLILDKINTILLNPVVITILWISLIIVLSFFRISNHIIITSDITFLFSEILLLLFHKLKDPDFTSAKEII